MATVEVFTVGGGEYIVNVFNAVAAWTGQGGYKSLLQVVLVMGFTMSCLVLAFNSDWRAWINWFLQGTLMYMCLMVPRVDVQVVDRINPSLAPSYVANVPLGLGLVASFTSQVGDYLTREAEVVFGMPDDMRYASNGMVYGARLIEASQGTRLNNPEFATNLDEHIRNCVFYDVLLGHKSMSALANNGDVWTFMGPGSPARAQKYITDTGGATTTQIITCQAAYQQLSDAWTEAQGRASWGLGHNLYKGTDAIVQAKLYADLGSAYSYLTGVSQDGAATMKQTLLLNAFNQSMHTMSASGGGSAVDVYAQTRADIQTKNTYSSIGAAAEKWVPLLQIVLTVIFYALFPVLFPLFLLPSGGVTALKGYITGFFYLAAWGPLFAILHMMLMFKGVHDLSGAAGMPEHGNMPTLISANSIADAASDIALLAGYMMASIPFLAGGIARGAMAISSNATSFLAPSQNAAEVAANEASTGNISLGNTSLDNQNLNNRQANNWSDLASYTSGASAFNTRGSDGFMTHSYPGAEVGDASGAISRLAVSPSLSHDYQTTMSKSASEAKARSETWSNTAASSVSSANTQASEFRHALSGGSTLERSLGADERSTVGETYSQIDNAATALQNRYGFDRQKSEAVATEYMMSGRISSSTLGPGGGGGGGRGGSFPIRAGAETGMSKRVTDSGHVQGTDSLSEAQDFMSSYGRSHNWGNQKDSFDRVTKGSSNSEIASKASSVSAAYTQAASVSQEARTSYDKSQRYEEAASLRDSSGVSIGENLSQPFVNYVNAEQRKLAAGGVASTWNPTRGLASTPDQRAEQAFYEKGFIAAERDRIASGVEPSLVAPTAAGISRPSANTQTKVRTVAEGGIAALQARGLPFDASVPTAETVQEGRNGVGSILQYEANRVGGVVNSSATEFNRVKKSISPNPQETLDRIVGPQPTVPEAIADGIVALIPHQLKK